MALANLIDQITVGEKVIAVVDASPIVSGFVAVLGSEAIWDDEYRFSHRFIKRGDGDMDWDEIVTMSMTPPNFSYKNISEGKTLIIPSDQQMLFKGDILVDGNLIIEGELWQL